MSIASLVVDKNASSQNSSDVEPVELVPPTAAPVGPGPEFAPAAAPAAAPIAAPAPAPAAASPPTGSASWLPWFLSPSTLDLGIVKVEAVRRYLPLTCTYCTCTMSASFVFKNVDLQRCAWVTRRSASKCFCWCAQISKLRQNLGLHLWHSKAHPSYVSPDQGPG